MPWLLQFCAARAAFATMFTAWSAVLPLLRTDWQMSAWQAGMVQSAYHVGFLVSLFSVGFLSDRHGARRIYLLSGGAAVVSGLLFALFADGFVSALLLYGLTGLCSGGSYTPGLAIVAQRVRERQGRAMGYYLAAASLGYAIGLLIASAMIPLAGWRGAFVVTACFPLLGMVLGYWSLREVPNVVHASPSGHGNRSRLREVVRNKPAMLSIWGYTFHAWELLGLWAWLPAFLAAAAITSGSGGTAAASLGATLTALTYLAAVVGSVLGGSLSDRFGRTRVTLLLSIASLACSFSFGWMVGLPMFLLVAVAIFYNVTGVADSSIHSTTLTELTDPRYLGAAYSLRSVLGFGAGAISPWVFGLVLDWGRAGGSLPDHVVWGLAWSTLGLGGLLGPVVIWRLRRMPEALKLADGKR
ncbi:MAG: MFS transporter [Sulfuritalea sp.]|jgi:MFS family permease|nr:MFS transporter [Sulfuritalea sp.]